MFLVKPVDNPVIMLVINELIKLPPITKPKPITIASNEVRLLIKSLIKPETVPISSDKESNKSLIIPNILINTKPANII